MRISRLVNVVDKVRIPTYVLKHAYVFVEMKVENQIRKLRLAKGLTQKQLAENAGTSQQQVQRLEAGVQAVRLDLAFKICKALDADEMADVFPTAKGPLSRARSRGAKPEIYDEIVCEELEKANFDVEPEIWTFRYRLRGGAQGNLILSGPENKRVWERVVNHRHLGGGEQYKNDYLIFDAGNRRYALNIRHLTYCHFLYDMSSRGLEEKFEEKQRELGLEALFYTIDEPEPLKFDCAPDNDKLTIDNDDDAQLQSLFSDAEGDVNLAFHHFLDIDGEDVFVRRDDVSLFSVPLCYLDPAQREAETDGEDNEDVEA